MILVRRTKEAGGRRTQACTAYRWDLRQFTFIPGLCPASR